jgi:hypothetical protein
LLEEWGEWMRETLLLDMPHRQVVFTVPRMLRIFFKYNRRLLGSLCRSALRSLTCYFEVTTGSELMPGVIAAIQTFGTRINLHPHLHFLVTEGGVDKAGLFHKIPRIDDSQLAELFAREVLADLVGRELLSPEWADRLLSWRRTGFNIHSRVRAKTRNEAERVGKYMFRPLLSLERLSLDEREGQVCYRYGKEAKEMERMDYLEFIARVTSAFLTDYAVVDRIIDHLKLTFVAERPPPSHIVYQELLMAAETSAEYLSLLEIRGLADFRYFLACPRLFVPFPLVLAHFDIR